MTAPSTPSQPQPRGFYREDDCQLAEMAALCQQSLSATDLRFAREVQKNVPIYHADALRPLLGAPETRAAVMAEWAWVLRASAGVLVIQGAVADTAALDAANAVFADIIAEEKAGSGGGGDHFAKAGANDRIWNSLQKLGLRAPEVFARCFASPTIAAVCEAWLGPAYQMTAQVNLVHPGGAAQSAHRDYHLGFQSAAGAAAYPVHVHELTAALTLQGAVAHTDMPIESGPTKLLPFSQLYGAGYVAFRRPEFSAYFEANCIQLPLSQGDALFFNPALFHAAGGNISQDVQRLANLLQVSSAFGRAMEAVDRSALTQALYPVLHQAQRDGTLDPAQLAAVISACAEGYAFPTNLDSDPPLGGLAPKSAAALMRQALAEDWSSQAFADELDALDQRRRL